MHCLWIWRARRFSHHVLICKLFGIDRLKGVSEVKLRKFFGHSFLATFFKLCFMPAFMECWIMMTWATRTSSGSM